MATPAAIWDHVLPAPYPGAQPKPASGLLGGAATHAAYARAEAASAKATAAECLTAILGHDRPEVDLDALLARIAQGTRKILTEGVLDVAVTVHDRTA